jgi:hypothetical protein
MKKLLGIAVGILSAIGLYAEDIRSDLTIETSVSFQTERVFRGRNEFHKTLNPNARLGYFVCDGCNAYLGIDTAISTSEETALGNVLPYLGVLWDVDETFTLDGGYGHYFYPKMDEDASPRGKIKDGSNEIYGGVIIDVLAEPSLYVFYDFDRKEVAVEGRLFYNVDLAQYAFSGLGVNLGAKVGFDRASKPYGVAYYVSDADGNKHYSYYGVNADLIYELNNNAKAKVGIAYEGNSSKQTSWVNGGLDPQVPGHKNNFWVNASIDCSF